MSPWIELPVTLFASRRAPVTSLSQATPLDVVRLDRTTWRVSDSSIAADDPARIMGFIEKLSSVRYEVLLLIPPSGWAYVETYGDALVAFSSRERFESQVESKRDPEIEVPEPGLFHRPKRRASHRRH